MSLPNLSAWAIRRPSMVFYLLIVLCVAGIASFFTLGRAEDPDFTIKVMVVHAYWPGATARQMELQVTEKLEKKLQQVAWMDVLRSRSMPGESLIFVTLKDFTPPKEVPGIWYQVRKSLGDIAHTLPEGVQGPFMNDEFGDVFGNIYALTGDGFNLEALRKEGDRMALELMRLPDVKKVELLGVQDEKIYVEISHAKLASLGLSPTVVADALQKQNALSPAGWFDTESDHVNLRVSGSFTSAEDVAKVTIQAQGHQYRLGDIAEVKRSFVDPPAPRFRFRGRDAIGVAVSMAKGGNITKLGESLKEEMASLESRLPRGIEIHRVSDQPGVVVRSINEFIASLTEALAIVLAVSFISLGLRTGLVVALSIPAVVAVSFLAMKLFGIDLQRISLGALIIALGLLVDDAIIAVEMMVVKMEQGWDRFKAATYAYTSTAFPMLTGTLVTAAGFLPVGFAKSAAGEYTFSIFAVVTIALLVSWIVAVVFTPFIGYHILDARKLLAVGEAMHGDIYDTPFYRRVRRWVTYCVANPKKVILITCLTFFAAIAVFAVGVQKQFFPSSNRPEVLVDLWLPQSASLAATDADARRVEAILDKDPAVSNYVTYVGAGSTRFYLAMDQQLNTDNFAQIVIMTSGIEAREALIQRLNSAFEQGFTNLRARVQRLENGPPVGFPVQFRVMGEDVMQLRTIADQVADVMRQNPHVRNVQFDWNEMSKAVHLEIDQDKARALGVSTRELSSILQTLLGGAAVTQIRDGDRLVDVVARAVPEERRQLSRLADMNIMVGGNGQGAARYVPLAQVVKISYDLEEGVIWRRNRLPTITVRADLRDTSTTAPEVSKQIEPALQEIKNHLPLHYRIETGGAIEESEKGEKSIMAVMPAMLLATLTLLMMQLQSMGRTLLVVATAPLGLIGVALILMLFRIPFGFVANLGVIALFGMIMRNSVILLDQIEQDRTAGIATQEAIIGATVRRFRPIMLTAAAAILAMIPLTRSVFWSPMAWAIMGGLMVATLLTLLVLPALYGLCYDRKPSAPPADGPDLEPR